MSHAGTIVAGVGESVTEKIERTHECSVTVMKRPSDFGPTINKML